MSRALLINLDEGQIIAKCLDEKVGISTIERLASGGVRLVCNSSRGADTMTRKLKGHLIDGHAVRERHRPSRSGDYLGNRDC
jgi:hypothetical protein